MYVLGLTNMMQPKPLISSVVDAEDLLQTLQQDVMINGVKVAMKSWRIEVLKCH